MARSPTGDGGDPRALASSSGEGAIDGPALGVRSAVPTWRDHGGVLALRRLGAHWWEPSSGRRRVLR
jgi:hypothetical protein